MEKMQSLLSDPESMQQLQELAQMLQADSGQESTETESAPTATEQTDAAASGGGLDLGNLLGGWNPAELLEQLDKDQILILVLLVMLYKEGGDKKLMMALAYLLT